MLSDVVTLSKCHYISDGFTFEIMHISMGFAVWGYKNNLKKIKKHLLIHETACGFLLDVQTVRNLQVQPGRVCQQTQTRDSQELPVQGPVSGNVCHYWSWPSCM